jgi:Fic family protein
VGIEWYEISDGVRACIPRLNLEEVSLALNSVNLLAEARSRLASLNGSVKMIIAQGLGILRFPLLVREAEMSSRIEGTRTTLEEALEFEVRPESHRLMQLEDATLVSNYVKAAELGFAALAQYPLSWRVLKLAHRELLHDVRGSDKAPGEFRKNQVHIGASTEVRDARYIPPPPNFISELTSELEKSWHSDSQLDPLVRCGIAHAQLELIHPFSDGNGRVGRLFIALFLKERGLLDEPVLVLSEYLERRRLQYYDALDSVVYTGSWDNWLQFFLTAVSEQALRRYDLVGKQVALYHGYKHSIREVRDSQARGRKTAYDEEALDLVFGNVFVTSESLQKGLRISAATANKLLERFVNLGILRETTGGLRNRRFMCVELLKLLKG